MKLTYKIEDNLQLLKSKLPLGTSFDLLQRVLDIRGRKFYLFFIDGFTKDTNLEYVRRDISALDKDTFDHIHTADELIERAISSI
ncbi:MAG: spore germination protein, partial [Cellulosilyticaceae bacterium]